MDDYNWYVLITKSRAEIKIGNELTAKGIENYVAVKKQLRKWHDRKKWVNMVIFNSYIFVRTTEKLRFKVFEIFGVIKFLTNDKKVCTLPDEEINRIKLICNYKGNLGIEKEQFQKGEMVEIQEGYFIGMCGEIIQIDNKKKFKIKIEVLNCFAIVEINKNIVTKLCV